jgi:hypothetical protein
MGSPNFAMRVAAAAALDGRAPDEGRLQLPGTKNAHTLLGREIFSVVKKQLYTVRIFTVRAREYSNTKLKYPKS